MIDSQKTKIEISCRAIKSVLIFFEKRYGRKELERFIEGTGMPLSYLEDENNWLSFSYFKSVLKAFADRTGDMNSLFQAGTYAATKEAFGNLLFFCLTFSNPALMYNKVIDFVSTYSKIAEVKILELKKNKAVIEGRYLEGFQQDEYNCLNLQGQLASIPTAWNLPVASVKHIQCQAKGAGSCVFEFTWINKPSRLSGFFGSLGGFICAGLIYLLEPGHLKMPGLGDLLTASAFIIGGYYFGRDIDMRKTEKENLKVHENQNDALRKSLKDIELLNAELQSKVEKRTEELSVSNSKLREAMDDLRQSQDRLVQSEKMASVGRLAAGMAHELNNPVGAVRNIIQDMLEDTPKDDHRWQRLKRAEMATERCKGIISELLTFARENKEIKSVDVNDIVKDIVLSASPEISEKGIEIIQELTLDLPRINVDSMQMHQVFMNIMRNAGDSITGEGKITVKTYGSSEKVLVEISDTGHGIPENIQDKIFDPFFTTKAPGNGIGLGLSISYNIIKRFNGDIQVKSIKGKGSSFTVMLPVK